MNARAFLTAYRLGHPRPPKPPQLIQPDDFFARVQVHADDICEPGVLEADEAVEIAAVWVAADFCTEVTA